MAEYRIPVIAFCALVTFTHTAKSEDNQYIIEPVHYEAPVQESETIYELAKPIGNFSQSKVACFLRHTFSRQEYAEELLPHTFAHLLEFLSYGTNTDKNASYALSTLRLFSNRLKSCSYINPDAVEILLDRMPEVLEKYFVRKPTSLLAEARNSIKRILHTNFLAKFDLFKKDPDNFLGDLSGDIVQTLSNTHFVQNAVDNEQLRQSLIRFLEIVLDKIIWTPLDQQEVWNSVKNISAKLQELAEMNIINMDELDDLYQSLTARFIHFLTLAGSDLSTESIDIIKKDIEAHQLLLLTLEEQEEFITPKAERLRLALEKVETKIIARAQGIIA